MLGLVKVLAGPITDLLSEFIEDKDKRNEIAYKIASQAHEAAMAQVEVNKVEAAHKSLFVAGWRPAVGWVCVLALANNYLFMPYAKILSVDVVSMDTGELMPLVLGMLGLGGARTYEKIKKVAREK